MQTKRSAGAAVSLYLLTIVPAVCAASGTPTPTPTPEPVGCCQADPVSRTGFPICGNRIKKSDCTAFFGARAEFCEHCSCSSHPDAGFTFDRGECVASTPTATPTATATPTSGSRRGCCQVNTSRPGPHPFLCGNEIDETSCLNDFGAGAFFCPDCTCSSHSGLGFGTSPGSCVNTNARPRPTRPPRLPRPTRAPR
ncbi:MAG: hypothetical protein HY270_19685 [Deltaproteobacteria bacterium]|nr:hypothetical protein [Deltaproteobacteria bacterium]